MHRLVVQNRVYQKAPPRDVGHQFRRSIHRSREVSRVSEANKESETGIGGQDSAAMKSRTQVEEFRDKYEGDREIRSVVCVQGASRT